MIQGRRVSITSKQNVSGQGHHCFDRLFVANFILKPLFTHSSLIVSYFQMYQTTPIKMEHDIDCIVYVVSGNDSFCSQTCVAILDGQVNDSCCSQMVSVCVFVGSFLFTDLLYSRILYRCLWFGNFPVEQLYCLFVTVGRPHRQQRPRPSNDRKGGQRISAICPTSSRI